MWRAPNCELVMTINNTLLFWMGGGYLPCLYTQCYPLVVLTHNFTPKLCTEYLVRLPCLYTQCYPLVVLTHNFTPKLCTEHLVRLPCLYTQCYPLVVLTHNFTPKLCTEYVVRLTLTNLDAVSIVPCLDTQWYP
jgi:hypothetical protein